MCLEAEWAVNVQLVHQISVFQHKVITGDGGQNLEFEWVSFGKKYHTGKRRRKILIAIIIIFIFQASCTGETSPISTALLFGFFFPSQSLRVFPFLSLYCTTFAFYFFNSNTLTVTAKVMSSTIDPLISLSTSLSIYYTTHFISWA